MKTSGWIGSIGLLLLIASCGDRSPEAASPTTTVVSPSIAPAASPQVAQSPTATVAVPPAPPVLAVPNLIPPTSAETRVPQINTGRGNPYGNVTTTPRVTVSPTQATRPPAAPTIAVRPSPAPAVTRSPRPETVLSAAPAPTQAARPAAPAPQPIAPPSAPVRPTAEIARSISVSGVVQTSGRTSAIVQLPQEGSRYVSVGDRLAGGRVLVKRIEAGEGEAIVVFEQDGVEVNRSVGATGVL